MLQMYSIFDKKAAVYEKPFFVKHVAEATRALQASLEMPAGDRPWFAKYPAEFSLYYVGSFDPTNGMYMPTSEGVPVWVIEVASLVPQPGGVA